MAWDDLGEDPYVLLVAAHDRLARLGRPIEPADVADRQVVGKDCGSPSHAGHRAGAERHGMPRPTLLRAHDGRTVREAVAAGVGVAFLPRLLVEPGVGTHALPVGGWLPPRRIALQRAAAREQTAATVIVADAVRRASRATLARAAA